MLSSEIAMKSAEKWNWETDQLWPNVAVIYAQLISEV